MEILNKKVSLESSMYHQLTVMRPPIEQNEKASLFKKEKKKHTWENQTSTYKKIKLGASLRNTQS